MKTTATIAAMLFAIAAQCLGAGDPVSSVAKSDREETTTFQRDGKMILKTILYRPTEPESRRLLRQLVIVNDEVAVDLTEFQGKRTFIIHPKAGVSVTIGQNSSTGALEAVLLGDDSTGIIEMFKVKSGRLAPVSGKKLDFNRGFAKDLGKLLAPENVKKSTPEGFVKQVQGFVKKHKAKESGEQNGKPTDNKPSPPSTKP